MCFPPGFPARMEVEEARRSPKSHVGTLRDSNWLRELYSQVLAHRTPQEIEELGRRATREVLKDMGYKPTRRVAATRSDKASIGGHVTDLPCPPHHIPQPSPAFPAASRRQNSNHRCDWSVRHPPAPTPPSLQQRGTPAGKSLNGVETERRETRRDGESGGGPHTGNRTGSCMATALYATVEQFREGLWIVGEEQKALENPHVTLNTGTKMGLSGALSASWKPVISPDEPIRVEPLVRATPKPIRFADLSVCAARPASMGAERSAPRPVRAHVREAETQVEPGVGGTPTPRRRSTLRPFRLSPSLAMLARLAMWPPPVSTGYSPPNRGQFDTGATCRGDESPRASPPAPAVPDQTPAIRRKSALTCLGGTTLDTSCRNDASRDPGATPRPAATPCAYQPSTGPTNPAGSRHTAESPPASRGAKPVRGRTTTNTRVRGTLDDHGGHDGSSSRFTTGHTPLTALAARRSITTSQRPRDFRGGPCGPCPPDPVELGPYEGPDVPRIPHREFQAKDESTTATLVKPRVDTCPARAKARAPGVTIRDRPTAAADSTSPPSPGEPTLVGGGFCHGRSGPCDPEESMRPAASRCASHPPAESAILGHVNRVGQTAAQMPSREPRTQDYPLDIGKTRAGFLRGRERRTDAAGQQAHTGPSGRCGPDGISTTTLQSRCPRRSDRATSQRRTDDGWYKPPSPPAETGAHDHGYQPLRGGLQTRRGTADHSITVEPLTQSHDGNCRETPYRIADGRTRPLPPPCLAHAGPTRLSRPDKSPEGTSRVPPPHSADIHQRCGEGRKRGRALGPSGHARCVQSHRERRTSTLTDDPVQIREAVTRQSRTTHTRFCGTPTEQGGGDGSSSHLLADGPLNVGNVEFYDAADKRRASSGKWDLRSRHTTVTPQKQRVNRQWRAGVWRLLAALAVCLGLLGWVVLTSRRKPPERWSQSRGITSRTAASNIVLAFWGGHAQATPQQAISGSGNDPDCLCPNGAFESHKPRNGVLSARETPLASPTGDMGRSNLETHAIEPYDGPSQPRTPHWDLEAKDSTTNATNAFTIRAADLAPALITRARSSTADTSASREPPRGPTGRGQLSHHELGDSVGPAAFRCASRPPAGSITNSLCGIGQPAVRQTSREPRARAGTMGTMKIPGGILRGRERRTHAVGRRAHAGPTDLHGPDGQATKASTPRWSHQANPLAAQRRTDDGRCVPTLLSVEPRAHDGNQPTCAALKRQTPRTLDIELQTLIGWYERRSRVDYSRTAQPSTQPPGGDGLSDGPHIRRVRLSPPQCSVCTEPTRPSREDKSLGGTSHDNQPHSAGAHEQHGKERTSELAYGPTGQLSTLTGDAVQIREEATRQSRITLRMSCGVLARRNFRFPHP
ncbi:hypothetical protein BDV93DRAFT_511477 [Ceratobasidium sp. AG-I]|nr:hypothetical protein BDV93DRAFT_511477 [Ceratobasidium sp. AG-I]